MPGLVYILYIFQCLIYLDFISFKLQDPRPASPRQFPPARTSETGVSSYYIIISYVETLKSHHNYQIQQHVKLSSKPDLIEIITYQRSIILWRKK